MPNLCASVAVSAGLGYSPFLTPPPLAWGCSHFWNWLLLPPPLGLLVSVYPTRTPEAAPRTGSSCPSLRPEAGLPPPTPAPPVIPRTLCSGFDGLSAPLRTPSPSPRPRGLCSCKFRMTALCFLSASPARPRGRGQF